VSEVYVLDCQNCIHRPSHVVFLDDGQVGFCHDCWGRVESKLGEMGKRYQELVGAGTHRSIAERAVWAEFNR
jgi:hypothetical protein